MLGYRESGVDPGQRIWRIVTCGCIGEGVIRLTVGITPRLKIVSKDWSGLPLAPFKCNFHPPLRADLVAELVRMQEAILNVGPARFEVVEKRRTFGADAVPVYPSGANNKQPFDAEVRPKLSGYMDEVLVDSTLNPSGVRQVATSQ